MSEELEKAKSEYLLKLRHIKLLEAGVNFDDVERYTKFINAENEEEIENQAQTVAADIKREDNYADVYTDDRTWKPF